MHTQRPNPLTHSQARIYIAILDILAMALMSCTISDRIVALMQTPEPTSTPSPIRAALPTATTTPSITPTTTQTAILTRTAIPSDTLTLTAIAPSPSPIQVTATATIDPSRNSPSACGNIPGTVQIGNGFFNLRERIVIFCNADLAAMDACEPRNLEYCHCNSTSGCCQNPGRDLSVGEFTTTLHYPAGTTSFQASIPPTGRTHNSDRVLILGFDGPLP